MRFLLQIVSLALVASSAIAASTKDRYVRRSQSMQYSSVAAAPRSVPAHRVHKKTATSPSPFVVTDLYTRQALDNATKALFLDSVSFIFTDPNSNTSTSCTYEWDASTTNTTTYLLPQGPETWMPCDFAGSDHFFYYEFYSYTSVTDFQLNLMHDFYDASVATYEAYESTPTQITLSCEDVDGADGCYEATYPAPQYFPIAN